MIAKKRKGKGPKTKRQVKMLREKRDWQHEMDRVQFKTVTKGTHV